MELTRNIIKLPLKLIIKIMMSSTRFTILKTTLTSTVMITITSLRSIITLTRRKFPLRCTTSQHITWLTSIILTSTGLRLFLSITIDTNMGITSTKSIMGYQKATYVLRFRWKGMITVPLNCMSTTKKCQSL